MTANRLFFSSVGLLALLLIAACGGATVGDVFNRRTPHEDYAEALERAGLAETALARDWLAAATSALVAPVKAKLPLTTRVEHDPSHPKAFGYRLQLERGRVLKVQLTIEADKPALVFIDLFALAEAYPDLKTNQTFQQLQARISSLENAIADRSEFYNESVNINNVRIEQFPDTIVAGMFGFKPAQLLEFDAAEKADVDVKKLFAA